MHQVGYKASTNHSNLKLQKKHKKLDSEDPDIRRELGRCICAILMERRETEIEARRELELQRETEARRELKLERET